jgi:hypothetical protein
MIISYHMNLMRFKFVALMDQFSGGEEIEIYIYCTSCLLYIDD